MFSIKPIVIGRVTGWGLVCLILSLGACQDTAPPQTPPPPVVKKKDAPRPVVRRVRPVNLNSANNLRGSGIHRYGFELPMGAKEQEIKGAEYIVTTQARLLRFFGSRKLLVKKRTDGWQINHTELSLKTRPDSDDKWHRATLYIQQGPGPGFTLKFDSGIPTKRPRPALLSLIERERVAPVKVAPAKPQAAKRQGAPLIASKRRAEKRPKNTVKPAKPGPPAKVRAAPKRLQRFSISRLKRAALKDRSRPGRTLDVSKRIYKWTKKKNQNFQD